MAGEGRRGRPPRGDVALTGAERSRAYRARLRDPGSVRLDVHRLLWPLALLYVSHDRAVQVRDALRSLPLAARAAAGLLAANLAGRDGRRFLLWEAYQSWHAQDPDAWPLPPADRIPDPDAPPREKKRVPSRHGKA